MFTKLKEIRVKFLEAKYKRHCELAEEYYEKCVVCLKADDDEGYDYWFMKRSVELTKASKVLDKLTTLRTIF